MTRQATGCLRVPAWLCSRTSQNVGSDLFPSALATQRFPRPIFYSLLTGHSWLFLAVGAAIFLLDCEPCLQWLSQLSRPRCRHPKYVLRDSIICLPSVQEVLSKGTLSLSGCVHMCVWIHRRECLCAPDSINTLPSLDPQLRKMP